jgi:hypothetical protein
LTLPHLLEACPVDGVEAPPGGIDLAKQGLSLPGARGEGSVGVRNKMSRTRIVAFAPRHSRCVIAMEACATTHCRVAERGPACRNRIEGLVTVATPVAFSRFQGTRATIMSLRPVIRAT